MLSLLNLASGSFGEIPIALTPAFDGSMNLSAIVSFASLADTVEDLMVGDPFVSAPGHCAAPGRGGEFSPESLFPDNLLELVVLELDLFTNVGTNSPPTSYEVNRLESTDSSSSISKHGFVRYVTENVNAPGGN